jgi:predicted O-methyltransferase YrrM
MSIKSEPLTQALVDYVTERFAREETERLHRMWQRAEPAGLPMIMIAPEQARLIRIILRGMGARRALDVGTLFGYSAATMADAMGEGGRVVTVDVKAECTRVAERNFQEEGLADRIEAITAPALEAMQRMEPDSFDFVLVDADKSNYENYLGQAVRLLRPGGVLAFDNAFAFGKVLDEPDASDEDHDGVRAIQNFNQTLSAHPDVEAIIVPFGDGLALGTVQK